VTVDNTLGGSDVLVKIYADRLGRAARVFFIPAGRAFTAESMSPGRYDVRFQDLDDGELAKSESFTLDERATFSGIEYSTIRLTLYKVRDGNMQTYPLSPEDF